MYDQARGEFALAGVDVALCREIDDPDRTLAILDEILAGETGLIVLGAGDDTVSQVAGRLAYTGVALALLPGGLAAGGFGGLTLPAKTGEAMHAIACGEIRAVDLGYASGRGYFVRAATIGLDAVTARRGPSRLEKMPGRAAHSLVGTLVALGHTPFRATIREPGVGTMEVLTHQLVITTGASPGAGPSWDREQTGDPQLRVFGLCGITTLELVVRQLQRPSLLCDGAGDEIFTGSEAIIDTSRPHPVTIDGKPFGCTPLRVAVAPRALEVVVPPGSTERKGGDALSRGSMARAA